METLRNAPGFFGPETSLLTDITLIVQILFYLVLCAGVVAQLQGKYKWHDMLQTPVVILNIFFIAFVMVPTFSALSGSLSTQITKPPIMVTAIHAMLGTVAQLLSIYCLLAGFKILPRKIGVLRYWMWGAFTAWTATIIFGLGVYILFYANPFAVPSDPPPAEAQPGPEIISEHDETPLESESVPTVSVATNTPAPVQPAETSPGTEPSAEPPVDEHAEDVPADEGIDEHAEDISSIAEPDEPAQPTVQPTSLPEADNEPQAVGEAVPTQTGWQLLQTSNVGPGARYEHAMQYNPATNQVFLFGGRDSSQDYNDVWVLNLSNLTWQQLADNVSPAPSPRHSTTMIVDTTAENLYIATGQGPDGVLNDVWQLDLATETWEDLSDSAGEAPATRYGGPGGNIDDNLLVTHGFGSTRYNDTWLFNTTSQTWQNVTPSGDKPVNRCLFAAAPAGDTLVIHGGCASGGFGPCPLDDTWLLDTASQTWQQVSGPVQPSARQHQSLVAVTDQPQAVLFGGQDDSRAALDDLWLLDLTSNAWQQLDGLAGPSARYNQAAVWIPDQGMLVYGGRAAEAQGDLWLLSASSIPLPSPVTQEATSPEPAPTETPVPAPSATPTPELITTEPANDVTSEHDGG